MRLTCHCPACEAAIGLEVDTTPASIVCPQCGHTRAIAADALAAAGPTRCLGCGNADLWRQKDFPQRVGLLMVALGAILSSIAWAYHWPILALSILGGFAIVDMVLFWVMPDVLVCYRCRARHRVTLPEGTFGPYDHEVGERYRQERLRLGKGSETNRLPSAG